jgi:hypothetical protein
VDPFVATGKGKDKERNWEDTKGIEVTLAAASRTLCDDDLHGSSHHGVKTGFCSVSVHGRLLVKYFLVLQKHE